MEVFVFALGAFVCASIGFVVGYIQGVLTVLKEVENEENQL